MSASKQEKLSGITITLAREDARALLDFLVLQHPSFDQIRAVMPTVNRLERA